MKTVNLDKDDLSFYSDFVLAMEHGKRKVDLYFRSDAAEIVKLLRQSESRVERKYLSDIYWASIDEACDSRFRPTLILAKGPKKKGKGKVNKSYRFKYNLKKSISCSGTCPENSECKNVKSVFPGILVCKCC